MISQGLGAPACARLLTVWYRSEERGTFWSLWTASNNVGGFLAPIIAGARGGPAYPICDAVLIYWVCSGACGRCPTTAAASLRPLLQARKREHVYVLLIWTVSVVTTCHQLK